MSCTGNIYILIRAHECFDPKLLGEIHTLDGGRGWGRALFPKLFLKEGRFDTPLTKVTSDAADWTEASLERPSESCLASQAAPAARTALHAVRLQQGRAPSQGWRLKSKVKMAAGSVSPQASPLGVQGASSSLCPHVAFSLCWCIRGVSLRVHTGQTGLGTPPPRTHKKGLA